MTISYEVITDPEALWGLSSEWEALLGRATANEPSTAPLWHRAWWDVFGKLDGRELRAIVFRRDRALVGVAPLLWRRHWYGSHIPFRRLELLASGEAEADEICSDYNGVVIERGAEEEVATSLGAALSEGAAGAWDELVLTALAGDSPVVPALTTALRSRGHAVHIETESVASYIPLPKTWEAYLGSLRSSSRYLVTRSVRELEAWAGSGLTFERASTLADVDRGFSILASLHGERWGEGGGVFGSERFCAFHKRAMQTLFDRGALELQWLSVKGEPVAALYNLVWANKVYYYQGGRRVDLPKQVRPGIALHARAIRRAIDEGRSEYDFLGGACRYKAQLAPAQRPIVRLRATNGRALDLACRAARRGLSAANQVRDRLKAFWAGQAS